MEQDARKGGDPDDGRITRDDGGLVPGFPDSGGFSDPPMPPSPELDRVVLIVPRMTPELDQALVLLVEKGWRVGTSPEDHFEIHDGPILAAWKYEGDRIVRTWIEGDKDPLDVWTLGWLYKGVDERP